MHKAAFTWFSVAFALSLGNLLPAVLVAFFPLGKGMALSPSKHTQSDLYVKRDNLFKKRTKK